jgi:hypothetical protein
MAERSPGREAEYLRERSATLREMAATAMPRSIADKLLEVAADLEKRAARLERGGGSRSDAACS